jgi:methionyl-tRNA formyltransferase
MKTWTALFSQTGSEIYEVSEKLNRYPDMILCNKQDDFGSINTNLLGKAPIIFTDLKPTMEQYLHYIPEDSLVTMHGWLRIVPGEVCDKRTIYNGHPGNIVDRPELKGFNPQEKAWKAGHDWGGCVIHEAVAEVDAGEVEVLGVENIKNLTLDQTYSILHDLSVSLWVGFLRKKFNEYS